VKSLEEEIEKADRSTMYMYIPLCSKAVAYKEAWIASAPCHIMVHTHHSNARPFNWLFSKP